MYDSYLEQSDDPRESFFEKVVGLIPAKDLSQLDYEANEQWFIDLVDKLYDICPVADVNITSLFVRECWNNKIKIEEVDIYEIDESDFQRGGLYDGMRDIYDDGFPDHIEHY